jgi:hypothetical protein
MLKDGNVSFHILPIEAFTFNYKDVHKVELEFKPRRKKEEETGMKNQYGNNSFERKER